MNRDKYVSAAVIRRLPRYYRLLGELFERGVVRISSNELADMMKLTASQIRQDLNCFGGFGQQGYGYNVASLHSEIGKIIGLDKGFNAILVGVGNLGRAFANHINFAQAGFNLTALFDKNVETIGTQIANLTVMDADMIESFCKDNIVDTAILCVPDSAAQETSEKLIACGITSFWNFTHYDIKVMHPELTIENANLIDGLVALCYMLNSNSEEADNCAESNS